jgi:hypothetical protein
MSTAALLVGGLAYVILLASWLVLATRPIHGGAQG